MILLALLGLTGCGTTGTSKGASLGALVGGLTDGLGGAAVGALAMLQVLYSTTAQEVLERSVDVDESLMDLLISRVRFFHVHYRNEDPSAWVSSLGWSIDSNIPFGDVEKGTGNGNWVIAPGIIWTHDYDHINVAPNIVYQFTFADDELDAILGDRPDSSEAVRLEFNLAIDTPDRYWLLLTPSYTWNVKNTEDAGFVKVFTGFHLNHDMSLGFELQYNFDVRCGLLQEVISGEKYSARVHWEIYF